MSTFSAKNAFQSIHNQVIDKSRFEIQAHQEEGPEVFEFNFIEYALYGGIDLSGSSIYPSEINMKNFKNVNNQPQTFQAFDFVVDMFDDVRKNINLAIMLGEAQPDNAIISNLEVVRSYEPPRTKYQTYLRNLLIQYNETIKVNNTLLNNITHFDHYVNNFFVFLSENFSEQPITFSAWLQSTNNSLFSTGLALSVAEIPFDDDNRKYNEFMSSDLFSFYKNVCLNRGFKVWKHCPYVLVADLGSPAITPYLNTNINDTLIEYYFNSYTIDYIYLYNNIIDNYNNLTIEIPFKIKLKMGCVTKRDIEFLDPQSTSDINHDYWINFYLDVRNLELGNVKGKAEIKKIKKYLKNLQNSLDNSSKVSYIDSIFRQETFKKPFGLSDSYRRFLKKEEQKNQKEDITGGSTIAGGTTSGGY